MLVLMILRWLLYAFKTLISILNNIFGIRFSILEEISKNIILNENWRLKCNYLVYWTEVSQNFPRKPFNVGNSYIFETTSMVVFKMEYYTFIPTRVIPCKSYIPTLHKSRRQDLKWQGRLWFHYYFEIFVKAKRV